MPSISGWMDKDTLICFIGEEPYLLKVNVDEPVTSGNSPPANMRHYPDNKKGYLGNEIARTELPSMVKYCDKQPVFSLDGQHIAFIGSVNSPLGDARTVYIGEIK
jgi:hypothetical protein